MKIGVLRFSYDGSALFQREFDRFGSFNVNLGDNVQSLAIRALLARLGVADADIVPIDRDTLPRYDGPPVTVILNGCFKPRCLPLPPQITPIFIGFEAKAPAIAEFADHLRSFEPIGCRDPATAKACADNGIKAYVSGCLSLSLPRRTEAPDRPVTIIATGDDSGALPLHMLRDAPEHLLKGGRVVYQRLPLHHWPMRAQDMHNAEKTAAALLDIYKTQAGLVVTPLHHAAAPCLAMGIPVILYRKSPTSRFGFLETLTQIYYANKPQPVDWAPDAVDLSDLRQRQEGLVGDALSTRGLL